MWAYDDKSESDEGMKTEKFENENEKMNVGVGVSQTLYVYDNGVCRNRGDKGDKETGGIERDWGKLMMKGDLRSQLFSCSLYMS